MITENSLPVSKKEKNQVNYQELLKLNRTAKPVNLRSDYSYSYNGKIKNKVCPDKLEFTKFGSYSSGADEFINIIKRGFAFSPSVYQKSYRNANNFIKCDILAIDVDNTKLVDKLDENSNVVKDEKGRIVQEKVYEPKLTLEEAMAHEFIKNYGLIYTSPSHTEEWNRYRVVFFLPITIDDGELVKQLLREINEILGNVVDSGCIDYARLFYGNTKAQWFNDNLSNLYELPYELILLAKENLAKVIQERELRKQERVEIKVSDSEIEQHLNTIYDLPPRVKGGSTYELYRDAIWGLCSLSEDKNFRQRIINIFESQDIFSGSEKHFASYLVNQYQETRANHTIASYIYGYQKLTGKSYPVKISKDIFSQFSNFQQWLITGINGISKAFLKGFKDKGVKLSVPELNPNSIIYSPDMELPKPSDYDLSVIPEFIVPRKYLHLKAKLKMQLIGLGWVLHDNSFMGEGKSHDVAMLGNVLYLDTNYKNPSIKEIEKMPMMPSRLQHGLYDVDGKLKADPEDRNSYVKVSPSNCHFKPLFRTLEDKGYDVEGDSNIICDKCPHNKQCKVVSEKGDTFGFKGERKEAIAQMKMSGQGRAHYKQIHPEMLKGIEESKDGEELKDIEKPKDMEKSKDVTVFENFTVVFEEAGQVNLKKSITASVDDIDKVISKITRIKFDKDSDKTMSANVEFRKDLIIDFLNTLRDVLVNAYEIFSKNNKGKFYGLNKEDILNNLSVPELTESELTCLRSEFSLDIDKVIPDFVGIDKNGVNDKESRRKVRNAENYLKRTQLEEINENLEKLPNNWFSKLLNVLFGCDKGTFRITKDNLLEIITIDDHHQKLAAAAHGLVLLDATKSTRQLKAIYAIDKPMMTFRTELPKLNNLKVINVHTTGLGSNNWSDYTLERLTALKAELTARHNHNIAFISPKKFTEKLGNNYYFGRDDRGSNELISYEAIAHLGKPMPNLGEAKIIYELYIDIESYTFEEFYQDLVRESQVQGLGRSRAQHSPKKTFYHYFVGTNQDMSFLESYGVHVENVNVIDICEIAGSKGDRTKKIIYETAKAIVTNGEKLTQDAIALASNISQQLVSKAFKNSKLGWKQFKNLLLSLYKEHKEKVVKNDDEQDLLELWLECPSDKGLEQIAHRIIKDGVKGLLELARELNASLHSCYRLLWLIAPLFDIRLLDMRDKILTSTS